MQVKNVFLANIIVALTLLNMHGMETANTESQVCGQASQQLVTCQPKLYKPTEKDMSNALTISGAAIQLRGGKKNGLTKIVRRCNLDNTITQGVLDFTKNPGTPEDGSFFNSPDEAQESFKAWLLPTLQEKSSDRNYALATQLIDKQLIANTETLNGSLDKHYNKLFKKSAKKIDRKQLRQEFKQQQQKRKGNCAAKVFLGFVGTTLGLSLGYGAKDGLAWWLSR